MYVYLFARSDIEYKELQLSEDQNQATKSSLTSSLDHRKHIKSKTVKMKTKLRAAPYPEVKLSFGYTDTNTNSISANFSQSGRTTN